MRAIGKSRRTALLLLVLVAGEVRSAAGQDAVPAPAAQLLAHERALADAVQKRDRAQLEQLLADDYVLRGAPDIDRTTWLKNSLTLCWGNRADIDGFELRQQDDVAIVSFVLTFYVDPLSCRPAVLRSLITDIWAQQGQNWRLRMRHSGPVPTTGADVRGQFGIVPQPPPTWKLDAELSASATGGNTSTRALGAAAIAGHRSKPATTDARLTFLTSEAGGVTLARAVTAQGRHARRLSERAEVFGRADYVRDLFAGIEHRSHVEGGLARIAAPTAQQSWSAALGIGVTIEDRLDAPQLEFATATAALAFNWTPRPGTAIRGETTLVMDVEAAQNWRTTNALAATVTLTRLLALRASQAFEYRRQPVPTFRRTDLRTTVAFVFTFERRPPLP
jgi:putative salt-induced outer membrane protein YdiY